MTKGLTLVEVMIAAAIILTAILSLLGVYNLYFKTALVNAELVQAAYLSEEGIEEIRFLRDVSWSTNIASLISTTTWTDNFQRTVNLSPVYRDTNSDIVSSGGSLDPDTKLVTSSVSWPMSGATTTRTISTYITNLYAN